MFGKPRNQRLPREAYRDPSRVTFFTIRATEETSPFAQVKSSQRAVSVEFNHELCQSTLTCLGDKKEDLGCDVLIACLMPDHLHVLARPRTIHADVLTLIDQFKGKATNESWQFGWSGRLWQPRNYDHVLWPEESLEGVAEYIAHNPVRKELVSLWTDWPYTVQWDMQKAMGG